MRPVIDVSEDFRWKGGPGLVPGEDEEHHDL